MREELGGVCREAQPGELSRSEELGSGSWSTVYRGQWRGRCVAVKAFHRSVVERPEETEKRWRMFLREARLLQGLRSPRIIGLLGVCVGSDGGPWLLLELGTGGTLSRLLHGGSGTGQGQQHEVSLRPAQRFLLASHVTEGVAYLHGQAPSIVHRDLKSQNVVVMRAADDRRLQGAKIIDLGLAEHMATCDEARSGSKVAAIGELPKVRGSVGSMAPECLMEASGGNAPPVVGPPADIWALGCILVEIFGGAPPHSECESVADVIAKVVGRREQPNVPRHVDVAAGGVAPDDAVRRLLQRCFVFEALGRPSAGLLLKELQELGETHGYGPLR